MKIMGIKEILKKTGLTEKESAVYLCLLENKSISAGEISKKTNIHRRNIYDILNRLIEKGFASFIIENNVRIFQAVNPKKILDILEEQKNEFEEKLPMLEKIYNTTKELEEIRVFKGRQGLKNIFQDQLEDNKEILIIGATNKAWEILPFYFKWYDKTRLKKKIRIKAIFDENPRKKIKFADIRFFPQKYRNPLAINIYKNKVSLILWKKEPLAIVIKNKEIYESYKKYFEFNWKKAKK